MADARYHEWLTPEGLQLLKSWKDQGLMDSEIAHRIGISKATLYEWKQKFPAFAEATRIGCRKAVTWLTPEGLARLKAMKAEGLSDRQITMKIGISPATLVRWRQRYPAIEEALQPSPTASERWLAPERLQLLRSWREEGITNAEFASRMGIGTTTLSCWKREHPELAAAIERIPPKYMKWLTPEGLAQVKCWRQSGLTDEAIAQNMGASVSSLGHWKNEYPQMAEALEEKRPFEDYIMENALYQSTLPHEETEYTETTLPDGSVVTVEQKRQVPGNLRTQMLWLRNRRKNTWGS